MSIILIIVKKKKKLLVKSTNRKLQIVYLQHNIIK